MKRKQFSLRQLLIVQAFLLVLLPFFGPIRIWKYGIWLEPCFPQIVGISWYSLEQDKNQIVFRWYGENYNGKDASRTVLWSK